MSRLRVALDGRPLQGQPHGGVGRYLAGLIPRLAEHVELSILVDRRLTPSLGLETAVDMVPLSVPARLPGLAWLELAVTPWLRRSGSIFHGTFNTLPRSFAGRTVLTVHDLAPQLHADDFQMLTRAAWRTYMRSSVKRANAITTVSTFSKNQIMSYFSLEPHRVMVAPDAVAPVFHPSQGDHAEELARSLGLPVPYVVAIGGAPRRGLPIALAAWRRAREQASGPLGFAVLGERRLASEPGLVLTGPLSDADWAVLLAGAQALCYPTRYEGFGLPGLEALASGTPVVCERVASLPEVLGDAACWSASSSPAEYAAVILRLLNDREWHQQRRNAGLARAGSAATWAQSADVLLSAYEKASA